MSQLEALFQENFLEYASYVIKDRAIPHIDDGLKPVQRRILHCLYELDDGKFHKVANVIGSCMKYHPHGDASIGSALVVLANKDIFIDRQGNFGNLYTGDPASAARYIECRSTVMGKDVMHNPAITEYVDSYDGRNREPVTFPAKIPVALALGTEGIAVGMATKILPHNLVELLEHQIAILKDQPFSVVPDFPTGGLLDASEYDDGYGKVAIRAKLDLSDPKRVIVREIPYGTTTESLIDSIESATKKGKIKVSAIQDFTAEKVEIEIKLMRGVQSHEVVDALYAFTDCEISLSSNIVVIRDNKPVILGASEILRHNTERLKEILRLELEHEAGQLRDKLHSKTLEQIFIENRIYKSIEEASNPKEIRENVLTGLEPFQDQIKREVTDEDVETLLRIPIRRISLYDIKKAEKEMRDIRRRLREIKAALADLVGTTISYIETLLERIRDEYPRRSQISNIQKVDVREAARRDLKLCYDKKTGYLGTTVKGDLQEEVSPYDHVLVIRKDGSYSVIDVPDKLFVDKNMVFCGFIDPERTYNLIYRNEKTKQPYVKRVKIEKYIKAKVYELLPEKCKLMAFALGEGLQIHLKYRPKERVRITEQDFALEDFPLRGLKAGGLKLANRELATAKFQKAKG